MTEVSCRAFSYFEQAAAEGHITLDELLEGSALTLAVLQKQTARVPWNDWAALCDRYLDLVGEPHVEANAEALLFASELAVPLRRLAAAVVGPRTLFRLASSIVAPMVYRDVLIQFEDLPNGRIKLEVILPDEYRGSRGWMCIMRIATVSLPKLVGSLAATAVGELGPRGGTLIVTLPPSESLFARLGRWVRQWRGPAEITKELMFQQETLLETERALRQTEEINRALVQAFPDLLIILDDDLRIVRTHGGQLGLQKLLGSLPQGKLLAECLNGSGVVAAAGVAALESALKGALQQRSPRQYEYKWAGEDRIHIVDIRLVPLGDAQLFIVARDVTERAALERRVTVSERMAWMGQLAAGVAHEVNNPLTYLMTNVEMLLEDADADGVRGSEVRTLLEECRVGVERVRDVVRDLSEFSRVDDFERTPLDISDVVKTAVTISAHDTRHRTKLHTEVSPDLPHVSGDPTRLTQVIVNLLVNAAHATEAQNDGTVTLAVRATDATPSGVRNLAIHIEDNGPGIPPSTLPRIFEPFFTTKDVGMGTGLGLAVSKTAIEQMGGTLTAENMDSGGARFCILLPGQREIAAAVSHPPHDVSMDGVRVLVIDDEPPVARAVARMLTDAHVELVHRGQDALDRLALDPDAFDVVLCDLMMPYMTGMSLFDSLADNHPLRSRFLFMTAGAVTDEAVNFLARPGVRQVSKPFTTHGLRRALADVVSENDAALFGGR